ncbi:hypothetical protein MIR68_012484 [Amoeboaphelidium protococcarum]|nr:hypothetical protein MIR68_012484 [Amoeboaphelidium protococcarum]
MYTYNLTCAQISSRAFVRNPGLARGRVANNTPALQLQAERLRQEAAHMPEIEGPPPQRADVVGWNQYSDDDEDEADELLRATRRRFETRQDEIEEIGDE